MVKIIVTTIVSCMLCLGCIFVDKPAKADDEMMATFINLKGYLCAKVVNVRKVNDKDLYLVKCIEYRNGTGEVEYFVDLQKHDVIKR